MPDQHFFSAAATPAAHSDVFGPLLGGERSLWQGRCAVAEYAFDEAASLPRWVLPETTEVLVTDHRVVYAYTRSDSPDDVEVTSGELRWLWPQHLRVQPGALTTGRAAAAAQLQLVCAASDGTFPALVFAGGDLGTVQDADRLANTMRHAIAHFRVDNADRLGLTALQARMLSRLLIGPEFSNYQGGEGQTVTLLGAMSVHRPAEPTPLEIDHVAAEDPGADLAAESLLLASLHEAAPRPAAEPHRTPEPPPPAPETDLPRPSLETDLPRPSLETDLPRPAPAAYAGARLPGYRPGLAADEARALQAAAAEEATQLNQPDLASRAASLAARVASLVSATEGHDLPAADHAQDQAATARATAAAERAQADRAAADRAAAERAQTERAAVERAHAERAAADRARAMRAAEQAAADREHLTRAQAAQLAAEQARADRAAADRARADRARAEQARAEQARAEQAQAERERAARVDAEAAALQDADSSEVPTTDLSSRAAAVRRAAARFAANAAKGKAATRRIEPEIGTTSRGNRHR